MKFAPEVALLKEAKKIVGRVLTPDEAMALILHYEHNVTDQSEAEKIKSACNKILVEKDT